ncbi:MAG: efflux RND transporter permease subunit [Oceanococcus sp.]
MNTTTPKNGFSRARDAIERRFARWGEICHDYPWRIILAVLIVLTWVSSYFPQIQVDMSTEGYLRKSDPARQVYDAFQREFGRDERLVILVQSDSDIVNDEFLQHLKIWHEALAAIPQVDKVDSLINARLTRGQGDELIVQDLLEQWPQNDADFSQLRDRIRNNPLYRNHFVNPDLTHTILVVTPDTYTASHVGMPEVESLDEFDFDAGFAEDDGLLSGDEPSAANEGAAFLSQDEVYLIIDAIRAKTEQFERDDFRIGIAGSPFMMHQLTYILGRDMFVFSALGILITSILLYAIFRRWIMVILPVAVSALSVYCTFALMAFFGIAITTSVQILPSLLLAVGVGNAVHIFTVYFQAVDQGKNKRAALSYALGHSGFAVVMTGLTTAGGLISFVTANMKPVADIGIVSPMGIVCALVFSLVLMPALIAVTPFKAQGLRDDKDGALQRFLGRCADISTQQPWKVVTLWFVLILVCLFAAAQLKPSHYPLGWFPVGSEIRDTTEAIDTHFGGATFVEIVVDSGETNGLHNPALLKAVDQALIFADELEVHGVRLGKSTSLIDINKELHQALNGNDPAFYRIPEQRELIAQELLLFENSGSDDLNDIVDSSFSKMRITAKLPFVDGVLYPDYLAELKAGFEQRIGPYAELTFTGIISILGSTIKALIGDTIRAYMLAFLIISPLMMLLVGSVRTGLISMIPNLAPIVVTLALMALVGIPLDAFTLLIGSIALGLAVDDTIHFMHNYQRYYASSGDSTWAVRQTLRTTGKALMITSLVLSAAFFVNLLGSMHNMRAFGLLTGFCIILAFLADVLLAPALMTLLAQWKEKQPKEVLA